MLPRIRAATAAPSSGAGASSWPDTAATPTVARRGLADPDPGVQAAALGALARLGDADGRRRGGRAGRRVRRRCGGAPSRSRSAPAAGAPARRCPAPSIGALDDPDPLVVVGAAWFLAERRHRPPCRRWPRPRPEHADARCREAAVAALGAIGDPAGLPAVLAALDDKPTVRRRATVALAGFDDPRVDAGPARGGRGPGLAGAPGRRRVARRAGGPDADLTGTSAAVSRRR